ncbi:MAG: hypothetical protein ACR2JW_13820 [Thermomicrobiales bacterium]
MDISYPIAHRARAGNQAARRVTLGAVVVALSMLAALSSVVVGAQTTYPPNTVVSTYVDLRYCNSSISIVSDSGGNLINVCDATGRRIFPIYPDGGYPAAATQYVVPPATNANPFANPFTNGAYANGAFLNGTGCPISGGACAALPAGGTQVGNVIYYTDNRYCGDGQVALVIGQGYYCQNGSAFVPNGNGAMSAYPYPYQGGTVPPLVYP